MMHLLSLGEHLGVFNQVILKVVCHVGSHMRTRPSASRLAGRTQQNTVAACDTTM